MGKILADKDVRKLLGNIILNADEGRINPNGIEIRLGRTVVFQSTGEEKEMAEGMFLKVRPGESVLISSYEDFVFEREAINRVFPHSDLMALITPTTTMMREGIMQSATKVDSGWTGTLNWGLRNSSIKDFVLGFKEPIFKLTIFLLENDEVPEIPYGKRNSDIYQGTRGISRSTRRIPVDIPKSKLVTSSIDQLDPSKQLREAGYPFDHISTELTTLHGKFEIVSKCRWAVENQPVVGSQNQPELEGVIPEHEGAGQRRGVWLLKQQGAPAPIVEFQPQRGPRSVTPR